VLFITGHGWQVARGGRGGRGDESAAVDWAQVARTAAGGVTLVIYMGLARLAQVQEGLLTALPPATPVALVERASHAGGRQARGRLRDLQTLAATHQIASPAILVVGAVLGTAAERPSVAELDEVLPRDARAALATS
jgi:siroheme synthase